MQPPVVTPSIPTGQLLTTPSPSQAWRVGTVLEALALSTTSEGSVRLQIGARIITANTALAIGAGQTLRLRVASTGATVVLKPEVTDAMPERIRTGIRTAIPTQSLQGPLLAVVHAAARLPGLPAPVRHVMASIEASVNGASRLTTSAGLADAIRDSGSFLENRLAQRTPALPEDWKATLLRAREQLRSWLGSMTRGNAPAQPAPAARNAAPATTTATGNAAHTAGSPQGSLQGNVSGTVPDSGQRLVGIVQSAAQASATPPAASASTVPAPGSVPRAATPAAADPLSQRAIAAAADRPSHFARGEPPPLRQTPPGVQTVVADARVPADPVRLVTQLVEHIEGALSRIRLNQLATVTPDPGNRSSVWLLELPVRHPQGESEIVPLRIEREERGRGDSAERAWTVDLAFDLGTRGALRARVSWLGGSIYTSFQADNEATRAAVHAGLDSLREALESQEIPVGSVSCGRARPADIVAHDSALLEEEA